MTRNYKTPHVDGQWADSRQTDMVCAVAIHAIADASRSADDIWSDPTPAEMDHVTMAVEEYMRHGDFSVADHYNWGSTRVGMPLMRKAAYIDAYRPYFDEAALIALESVSPAEFDVLVAACIELTGQRDPGIDCNLVKSSETMDDWDKSEARWNERCASERHDRFVIYRRVQMRAGQRRIAIAIVPVEGGTVSLVSG